MEMGRGLKKVEVLLGEMVNRPFMERVLVGRALSARLKRSFSQRTRSASVSLLKHTT